MAKSEWEWLQVVKKYGGDLIKVPVAMRTEELCELAVLMNMYLKIYN